MARRRGAPPSCVPSLPREPAETPRRHAPHGRTARPRDPLDFHPRRPAPRACPAQHRSVGRPPWRLTPDLEPGPLFHSALCSADSADAPVSRRRGSIRETGEERRPWRREPGPFRFGYDAPACASGPPRSRAEHPAAPDACLTSAARASLWAYRLALPTPKPRPGVAHGRQKSERRYDPSGQRGRRRINFTALAAWPGGT